MKITEHDKFDGYPFEDAVQWFVDDLEDDIKFNFVIIGVPRYDFRLSGLKLLYAVWVILLAMTRAGARPVRKPTEPGTRYRVATEYGDTPEAITRTFMRKWQAGGYDDDGGHNDIWFASPAEYNLPWTEADMARDKKWHEDEQARHRKAINQRRNESNNGQ